MSIRKTSPKRFEEGVSNWQTLEQQIRERMPHLVQYFSD